jgi:hypothetical protein
MIDSDELFSLSCQLEFFILFEREPTGYLVVSLTRDLMRGYYEK